MLINRLIKMYGLGHKHIRIEDQQLNLKMNKIAKLNIRETYYIPIFIKDFFRRVLIQAIIFIEFRKCFKTSTISLY